LREKRLADKRGHGMDALRQAELSMDIKIREDRQDLDSKIDNDLELMDEAAARRAIEEGVSTPPKSSSLGDSTEDSSLGDESIVLGEDEAQLLGLKNGGQMKKILDGDRARKGKMKKEKAVGLTLWDPKLRPVDCSMDVVKSEFPSELVDDHPVFRLLGHVWHNGSGM
jgi:hypothetical protein